MSSEIEWQLDSRYGAFKGETFAPFCCPDLGFLREDLAFVGLVRRHQDVEFEGLVVGEGVVAREVAAEVRDGDREDVACGQLEE